MPLYSRERLLTAGRFIWDAEELCNFLARARCAAELQQRRSTVVLAARNERLTCFRWAVVQHNNTLILPIDEHRRGQSRLLHDAAHGWNTGAAVLGIGQALGHHCKHRIACVRVRTPKILYRHTAIQRIGAVDLQTVAKKIDMNRRSFGIDTVIAVNKRVQHGFAYRADRIFGPVAPFPCYYYISCYSCEIII